MLTYSLPWPKQPTARTGLIYLPILTLLSQALCDACNWLRLAAVVRTYVYEGEDLCDRRMSVFRKSIEAAALSEGQGFAAIKVWSGGGPQPAGGLPH